MKATKGDNRLGGDDWDYRIVDWLVKQFKNKNGTDLSQDKIARQRLQEAAEKAKIELSSASETSINLPYITLGRVRPAAPGGEADPLGVPAAHLRPARSLPDPVQRGDL